jgi:hypothetical protein
MKTLMSQLGAVGLALAVGWFAQTSFAAGGEVSLQTPEEDIAIQARGPVHEAYAEPVEATAGPGLVVTKQPPKPIPEEPPDQRPQGDNVQWIPGYWGWDPDRRDFLWVSGSWRVPPPGRKWMPGYWTRVEDGWQWTSGFWAGASLEQPPYQEEPPASLENGPAVPPPAEDRIYVPGCWVIRSAHYVWRPGFWIAARQGFCWIPAHYCYTPLGYVFVDGYWDYAPEDRGLLFAPVVFNRPLWSDPSWYYQPTYCVSFPALLGSLFVRPAYGHYYFGDFYGPAYARQGLAPWYAWGRRYQDPLYNYYGWVNRGDPGWARGLRSTFVARYRGDLVRPPRTLAQQSTLIQNYGGRYVNSLRVVQPLGQVRMNRRRLTRVSRADLSRQRDFVRGFSQRNDYRRGYGQGKAVRSQGSAYQGQAVNPARRAQTPSAGPRYGGTGRRATAYRPYTPSHRNASGNEIRSADGRGNGQSYRSQARGHTAPRNTGRRAATAPANRPRYNYRAAPRPNHRPVGQVAASRRQAQGSRAAGSGYRAARPAGMSRGNGRATSHAGPRPKAGAANHPSPRPQGRQTGKGGSGKSGGKRAKGSGHK